MEVLFEILFYVFGELLLQVVVEALAEVGVHVWRRRREDEGPTAPWKLILGYPLLGFILGALSLAIVPQSMLASHLARVANLALTPVLSGAVMVALGRLRVALGQPLAGLDRFVYGYLFAFAMALARFLWAG